MNSFSRKRSFTEGLRDAVPIGLGYFAVAFSLGISAHNAGLTAVQGFIASILCVASAGEYAGFTLIAAGASYAEVSLMTFITNMRYMLMSLALSQRCSEKMPFIHRLIFGYAVTDELFAINIARPGHLDPWYYYGGIISSAPLWAIGTALGVVSGNLLPARIVSALSVALYGMFLAIIIPPAKKSRVIGGIVLICFAASWISGNVSFLSGISAGTRTIILTLLIASAAALLFPVETEDARATMSGSEKTEAAIPAGEEPEAEERNGRRS